VQPAFTFYFGHAITEILYGKNKPLFLRFLDKALFYEEEETLGRYYFRKEAGERLEVIAEEIVQDTILLQANLSPSPLFKFLLKRLRRYNKLEARQAR
jgi:hypothetical protein